MAEPHGNINDFEVELISIAHVLGISPYEVITNKERLIKIREFARERGEPIKIIQKMLEDLPNRFFKPIDKVETFITLTNAKIQREQEIKTMEEELKQLKHAD